MQSQFQTEGDDGWDWPWMLFSGTVLLGFPEEEFWNMTPVKFCSLLACQSEYNRMTHGGASGKREKAKGVVQEGFIDQLQGW